MIKICPLGTDECQISSIVFHPSVETLDSVARGYSQTFRKPCRRRSLQRATGPHLLLQNCGFWRSYWSRAFQYFSFPAYHPKTSYWNRRRKQEELVVARELQDSGRLDRLGLHPPNLDSSARGRGIEFAQELHVGIYYHHDTYGVV